MRQGKYLNGILTVIAVLLAVLLWTQVASRPVFSTPAVADGPPTGFPNAAAQRQRMIEALQQMRKSTEASNKLLTSGKLRVEVTNIRDFENHDDG